MAAHQLECWEVKPTYINLSFRLWTHLVTAEHPTQGRMSGRIGWTGCYVAWYWAAPTFIFSPIARRGLLQYHRLGLWCDRVYCCLFLVVHPVVPTSLSWVQRDSEGMRKRVPFISANFPFFVMDGFLIVPFGPLKNVLWSRRNCQFPYHTNLLFKYPAVNCLDTQLFIPKSLFNPQKIKNKKKYKKNAKKYENQKQNITLSHRRKVSMGWPNLSILKSKP